LLPQKYCGNPNLIINKQKPLKFALTIDLFSADNLPNVVIISVNVIQASNQRTQYESIEFKYY
jgi:hypothetical protein